MSQWPKLENCYPKCYDLSKKSDRQDFREQYILQFMTSLLRKLYNYCRENKPYEVHKYSTKYKNILEEDGTYCTDDKYFSSLRSTFTFISRKTI